MTVTRLYQTGAESGHRDEVDWYNSSYFTPVTSPVKTGSYSYRSNVRNTGRGEVYLPGSYTQYRAGFQFQFNTSLGNLANGTLWCARNDSLTYSTAIGWNSTSIKNSYDIRAYYNGSWQEYTSTHPIATLNNWFYIALDVKIHDTNGWFKVWVDGILELDISGNTGTVPMTNFVIGTAAACSSVDYYFYFDDYYVDNTGGETSSEMPPPLKFYPVFPNGAGNYTQWSPSSGNNYECVDEKPPSDSDYVTATASGQLDSYNMTSITLETNETVEAVIPFVRTLREGDTEILALGTRYSSTDVIGSGQIPAASYNYIWERQDTKPGGGSWDQTSINGFETIIKGY